MSFLVQLTDTHIVEPGQLLYGKVDTAAHLADAVEQVNRMSPQPDVVMISGDLVEHPGPETYGNFERLIRPLRAPTYLIPGNHDDPRIMREHFGDSPWFPVSDETFQYSVDDYEFRILALNSHFDNSELPFFGPRRLAWLEKALAESDKPTLIAIHHPPMQTGVEFIDMVGAQWYADLTRVMAQNPQVQLVISGHGHSDICGRNGIVPVYMAGSTAHQLIAGRGNDHAPAFDERAAPPVMHQWMGAGQGFVSGAVPWPEWAKDRRIDLESGLDWETLKDNMRGSMRK
jgi:3',5'-cyclic AMP phosphodiesterase CpdA